MSNERIVEAFGKFMAEIEGKIVHFDSLTDAETAVALAEGQEEMEARADAYCEARGLEGKNAKAKTRIITDFLAYEATLTVE